jgi:2,4-dienoyl-CoA reductase-like NADH-dependent reductase (Old Yellow Enzyme family)/NADPH-dependent 2,4-dienoyl-CoA reductase/sulfur reductase-like enzyme
MSDARFAHLLSPGRLGSLALRNRIVMTPMGTNQERADGRLGDAILDYYEARARGGVALVIAGVAAITWPDGACNPNQAALSDDRFLPDWEEFARRCHRHGAKAAAQLQHASKVAQEDVKAGRPMWVPSVLEAKAGDLFAELTREELAKATSAYQAPGAKAAYHVMTEDDVAFAVERFADAAARAQRAGLDGVELHAGHGYLLSAFLSPASNRRTDRWGGSLENRARLLVETIRAVRARVGAGFAVWCRLDAKEFRIPGGITEEDGRRAAELAEAAGADAVHVSAYADPTSAIAFTDAPLVHEPGGFLPLAAAIKRRLRIPVIAVGRIAPELGDEAIRDGRCDFVAMGRKLLADPELPRRLAEERPDAARPCIYAYRCVGNVFLREASRCVVNPALGREAELSPPAPRTARPRRIAVVGGGPVGLELARVAAERGHAVVLYEREHALGGRARLAARLDAESARFLAWLEHGARAAGAEIRLGESASAARLAGTADAFVIATGARRAARLAPAEGAVQVEPVERLADLLDSLPPGRRVAVSGSDVIGVKAAEALAEARHAVTLLEGGAFAPEMGLPRRWRAADLLARLGAVRVKNVVETALTERGIRWRTAKGEGEAACDLVLDAAGLVADELLAEALRAAGAEAHAIGDCRGPRYLEAGLLEAARLARAL